jgi:hypothetical protein
MSSEKCRFAVKQIDLWTRAAMLVLMLAAAPHVSAQASREPDDGSEDDRQLRTTSAKAPVKKGATTGSNKNAGKKDSGAAHAP